MILHHFNPEFPSDHYLLSAEDLAFAIVNNQDFSITPVAGKGIPAPSRTCIDSMAESFCELVGRKIPRRKFTARPAIEFVLPEWLFFTDISGKHHFILHTLNPVFLCPFKQRGEHIEVLNPIADNPPIPEHRLDDWLDLAATATEEILVAQTKTLKIPTTPP